MIHFRFAGLRHNPYPMHPDMHLAIPFGRVQWRSSTIQP